MTNITHLDIDRWREMADEYDALYKTKSEAGTSSQGDRCANALREAADALEAAAARRELAEVKARNALLEEETEKALALNRPLLFRIEALKEGVVSKELKLAEQELDQARRENERLREALKKIYTYRSDKPDWNMVMAIAEDAINPMVAVPSALAPQDKQDDGGEG